MPHAPAPTTVTRQSDLELVTTRSFQAPAQAVFAAWTTASLFQQWWAPKSSGVPLLDCEMDARTGGGYRLVFGHDAENSMAFYGRYLDVAAPARLVWTNEENEEGAVTTVTFSAVWESGLGAREAVEASSSQALKSPRVSSVSSPHAVRQGRRARTKQRVARNLVMEY